MQCDTYKRCKHESVAKPGLLRPLGVPDQAWANMTIDFLEGLSRSKGRNCVLVMVDRLTKYSHFILSYPFTTKEVARMFLDNVVKLHGVPQTIITDKDKVFTSLFWQGLLKSLGSKLHMSTAYHPKTNDQSKSVNQCLETYLRCFCFIQPKKWHKWLSLAQWWYNSSHHRSIGMTPFEALYGYKQA